MKLSEQLRDGRLSAVELLETCLQRVRAWEHGAALAHVSEVAAEEARERDAQRARGEQLGPLHGVPVTVKDLIGARGLRQTYGCEHFATNVADADSVIVQRLRAAGAVILGSTLMSEMGISYHTPGLDNPAHPGKSAGGSSGGEAVACAARLRPVGVGGDVGGGIRIPSAWCGCLGLRPTWGLVPQHGVGVGASFIDKTFRFAPSFCRRLCC
jgi:Asp-tRNA(Asn)/Glu-tRNA(Gln) amidotransferase A subunit family amidase